MRLATKLPVSRNSEAANADPREGMSAEVIDLASRNAFPAVTQRKGKSDALGLMAGIGIVGLLGAVTLWGLNASRTEPAAPPQQQTQPAPPPAPVQAPPPPQQAGPAPAAPAPQADPAPSPVLARAPDAVAAANPYSTPTVVFDASTMAVPSAAVTPVAPDGTTAPAAEGGSSDFAARIGGVGGGPARAARSFDPQTTVTSGTLIPAVLETAIDTDVPGFVRAVVSQDVRSYDGTRVLIPRSSRLIGQYQSGLQAGQKRAYVIWTRLIRPDGITVDIASPATDFSGRAGLPGDVNNHFFKRFGSAMLMSVIGGLTAVASGGASVFLGGGQSAAAAALEQDGKIGPTVRVRQGEPVRVFTSRDLDFAQAPTL